LVESEDGGHGKRGGALLRGADANGNREPK
jgi:hypothetical protein